MLCAWYVFVRNFHFIIIFRSVHEFTINSHSMNCFHFIFRVLSSLLEMHFWTNYRFFLQPEEERFRSQHLRMQDTMFIWWQMSFCFTNEPLRFDSLDFYLINTYSSPFRLWSFEWWRLLLLLLRQMVFFSTFVSHCKAMNAQIRQQLVLIRAKF